MLVYVFCYNDVTARKAEAMAREHSFLRPYRLGPSPYFEAQFFFIPTLPYHEWMEHDYVGFISYKYLEKVGDDNLANLPNLCKSLSHCDVIALHDYDYDLISHASKMHGPHFEKCWNGCLEPFYTASQRVTPDMPSFYCNYWLAKPSWTIRYCKFAQQVKQHIDHSPDVKDILFENSGYKGTLRPHELVGITRRPHYTYHAFIFERLPCIFFYHAKASIGRRRRRSLWKLYEPFTEEEVLELVPASTTRLCVFAIHSTLDHIDHNTLLYLDQLTRHFDLVLTMTTQIEVKNAEHLPDKCVLRMVPNQCHDFGMWFRVIWNLPLRNIQTLALVNDSCQILKSLDEVFGIAATHPDWKFWGVSDSAELQPHLQTYFVVCVGDVIQHLIDFVHQSKMSVKDMQDKWTVVRDFEIGLSTFLTNRGIKIHAVYPYERVNLCFTHLKTTGSNPSLALWDRLLVLGCPLLKKKRIHHRHEADFIKIFSDL